MSMSISPYALLCASKPKHAPTIVTPYDLFSATNQTQCAESFPEAAHSTPITPPPAATVPFSSLQQRRTHYIADIRNRHNQAANKTSFR